MRILNRQWQFSFENMALRAGYAEINGPARLHEAARCLQIPAMSDADSVGSEPSKDNFRRFW